MINVSDYSLITSLNLCRFVSKGCKLVGCGSAVPSVQISNDDLSKFVDTSDEWISVRTGIRNRRILSGELFFAVRARMILLC